MVQEENFMKAFYILILAIASISYPFKPQTLKGGWKYIGGIYKGKAEGPSKDYILKRKYDDVHFNAYLLEPQQPPYKYQSGNYSLQADSCLETETFSTQPSKLTGFTIRYHFRIDHDTLKLKGLLPNGNAVEEHWLRLSK